LTQLWGGKVIGSNYDYFQHHCPLYFSDEFISSLGIDRVSPDIIIMPTGCANFEGIELA
jgi:hypothetical protein